jgi:hypothetical protein
MNRPSPSQVRVPGTLGAYAAGFREQLSTLGYSARSAAGHLQLKAHLSTKQSSENAWRLARIRRYEPITRGSQPC